MSESKPLATISLETEAETDSDRPPSGRADDALQFIGDDSSLGAITAEDEKRVVRKVDYALMPAMIISLTLQFMDRACLSAAVLFGIMEDLELVRVDDEGKVNMRRYSNATSIVYWGFLAGAFPGSMLCQKLPIAKYISAMIFVWGGITMLTATVKSYEGLLAQRFFLGFAEASLSPSFSLITAMWYRRHEQPLRMSIWWSSTGIGSLISSMLLYGIGHIKGPVSPWRYQFIVLGGITCIWAVILSFLLPNNPMTAWFLTPEQRLVAVKRIAAEQTGIENKTIKPAQIKEALCDPKSWAYVIIVFLLMLTNGPLSGFAPVLAASFGLGHFKTLLVLSAAGAVVFVVVTICGIVTVYFKNARLYLGLLCCVPVVTGALMVWKSSWDDPVVPLWGIYFLSFFAGPYVMLLSLFTANTAGHTKKAFTAGMVWTSYCISNGIAPHLFFGEEKEQHYHTTFKIVIATMTAAFAMLVVLRVYLVVMNRNRDKAAPVNEEEVKALTFRDMTDKENRNLRYQM